MEVCGQLSSYSVQPHKGASIAQGARFLSASYHTSAVSFALCHLHSFQHSPGAATKLVHVQRDCDGRWLHHYGENGVRISQSTSYRRWLRYRDSHFGFPSCSSRTSFLCERKEKALFLPPLPTTMYSSMGWQPVGLAEQTIHRLFSCQEIVLQPLRWNRRNSNGILSGVYIYPLKFSYFFHFIHTHPSMKGIPITPAVTFLANDQINLSILKGNA